MIITINILDIKQAVEDGKLSFKVGPKGVYCIDEITQECLLVTVERKDNKDLQCDEWVSENLNLNFKVVKKRIKPIDMFGIREAVENGVIAFKRTDKGILCEDVNSGERVCVHTYEKKENRQYVICINCGCVPMFFTGLVQKQTVGYGKIFVSNSVSSAWQTTDVVTLESMVEEINNALQERPDLNIGLGNVKIGVIDFGSKR